MVLPWRSAARHAAFAATLIVAPHTLHAQGTRPTSPRDSIRPDSTGRRAQLDSIRVTAVRPRPLLTRERATTGGAIEAAEVRALPTDARDPIALLYNMPGIAPATGFFGDAPRLSFNGGNALYSQYLLDGLDNNEGFLGGPRVEVPLGAIARMDALVNGYGVEVGRTPDGIVNMTTAPGTGRRSGDLFVYQRPGRPLDARIPRVFGTAPEALDRRQEGFERLQAGGSLRGALRPGRTFAAGAVEYTREQEDRIGSTALATFLGTETRQTWKGYGRVDHGWSPTQTTTLRLAASAIDREGNGSGALTPEADITTRRVGTLAALMHRSSGASGRWTNSVATQLGTYHWYFPPARSNLQTPQVTVLAPDLSVQAIVGSSNFVFDETERQLQLRDVFEVSLGDAHRLRTGADIVHARFRLAAASTNPFGSYVVFNDGNITAPAGRALSIQDVPANVRVQSYTIDARPQQVNLSQTMYGAFLEDVWRPSPQWTVVTGLRWDYDDLTSRGESTPDLDNVQPRVSLVWERTPREVLRGSVGRYAGRFPYAIYSDAVQLGANGNAVLTYEGASAPAFRAVAVCPRRSVPRRNPVGAARALPHLRARPRAAHRVAGHARATSGRSARAGAWPPMWC
jgi:outer membrane receptor protein involved in Fe transport